MRGVLWVAAVLGFALCAGNAAAKSPSSPSVKAFKLVASREGSGVVGIQTTTSSGQQLVGSGVVIGPTLVATVEHLVHGAKAVAIKRGKKVIGTGTVIGADDGSDLALIQSDTPIAGYEFKVAARPPKVGAAVAVLSGAPNIVAVGSVGSIPWIRPIGGITRRGVSRTDALVLPIASGGAIVTASGSLVGLVDVGTKTAKGLAYVVASSEAAPLIAGWKNAPQPIGGALLNGCVELPSPKPKPDGKLKETLATLAAGKTYDVTIQTNCGTFTIQLDQAQSPNAVASFVELALKGFFDHTIFHRIVPGFVIQGGDPTGTGAGGPGYETVDTPPANAAYTHGVVAMAKASDEAPGTAGSQFFIVTPPRAALTPDYAIIGKVTAGLNVVDRIGQLGQSNEQPVQVVELETASVSIS
ncbi:MAG TPA: peptidylprolyl isomerase [Gaiellaceae bacterium]|nr:peptidylprolyl isomerase [Gaiellaceae bacterium]